MTPEEKSISLIDQIRALSEYPGMSAYGKSLVLKHAKECAIICVDEIIESLQKYGTLIDGEDPRWIEPDTEYWQQVKTAIELL